MTTIKAVIKNHPVPTYFALTFAISWGLVLLVVGGPGGIPGTPEQTKKLLPIVVLAMLVGPSLAGILLTGLAYGRAGFRELLSRLIRWRVGVRWYAVAILTTPVLAAAALLALLPTSPVFIPGIVASGNKASLLLSGIVAGLSAGIFEELGWTGFAVPRLRQRYSVLTTGLIVGFLWGAWHYLVAFLGGGNASGKFDMPLLLAQMLFYVGGPAGLQGAHGVGLRPYPEPARGHAHARVSHRVRALYPHASGDVRNAPLDLVHRIGRRAVGGRCSGRRG